MTYQEVREIARDLIAVERSYDDRERVRLSDEVQELRQQIDALSSHFGVYIERDRRFSVIPDPSSQPLQF